jgi:hypothetical protein
MKSSQLETYNLTKSDLVKDHLRYLVITLFEQILVFLLFDIIIYFASRMGTSYIFLMVWRPRRYDSFFFFFLTCPHK